MEGRKKGMRKVSRKVGEREAGQVREGEGGEIGGEVWARKTEDRLVYKVDREGRKTRGKRERDGWMEIGQTDVLTTGVREGKRGETDEEVWGRTTEGRLVNKIDDMEDR